MLFYIPSIAKQLDMHLDMHPSVEKTDTVIWYDISNQREYLPKINCCDFLMNIDQIYISFLRIPTCIE